MYHPFKPDVCCLRQFVDTVMKESVEKVKDVWKSVAAHVDPHSFELHRAGLYKEVVWSSKRQCTSRSEWFDCK